MTTRTHRVRSRIPVAVIALIGMACATAQSGDGNFLGQGRVVSPLGCVPSAAWTLDGQAVHPPTPTRCVIPLYPDDMRSAGEQGEIVWRIEIDSLGVPDPKSFKVVRTTDARLVTALALSSQHIRYRPGSYRRLIVELKTGFGID